MKKPDEIKRGMECCHQPVCPKDCPYNKPNGICEMTDDVEVYIQQLEADNAQLNRCIETLTDKLNAANDALPRWISVEDRLPEHDVYVLVGYDRFGSVFEGCYSEDEAKWYDRECLHIATPSHWMPLPEPPKEE